MHVSEASYNATMQVRSSFVQHVRDAAACSAGWLQRVQGDCW